MKRNFIFTPLALAVGAMVWVSASGGVAQEQSKDRTGSPVSDAACSMCHSAGANYSTVAGITITDSNGMVVTEYVPGDKYMLSVGVQSSGNSGHGFQVTGLLDDNTSAGTCNPITAHTQKTGLNNRWYFEQSSLATGGVYEMEWFAPQAGNGNVTFYGSVLSANGNNGTGGDEYKSIPSLLITESTTTSIASLNIGMDVKLYPNPVVSNLNVSVSNNEIDKIELFDMNGRLVISKDVKTASTQLNMDELVTGQYFVKVISGKEVKTISVLKN
jgi:hypothetical protein